MKDQGTTYPMEIIIRRCANLGNAVVHDHTMFESSSLSLLTKLKIMNTFDWVMLVTAVIAIVVLIIILVCKDGTIKNMYAFFLFIIILMQIFALFVTNMSLETSIEANPIYRATPVSLNGDTLYLKYK